MTTKARLHSQQLEYYDSTTREHTLVAAPLRFYDDFIGKTLDTAVWGTRDTAGATEAVVADAASGVLALTLTNANEAQLGGIDMADQRNFAIANSLVAEFRFRFTTLPTLLTVACLGLCGDHDAAVDTVAESIWFRFDGATGGLCTVENDDTANETSQVTTGVTLAVNTWMIGRIELLDSANCKFFINGAPVATTTTFDMTTVPTLTLQPVCRIGKEGIGVDEGVLQLDYVKIFSKRS